MKKQLKRYVGKKAARRMARAVPFVAGALAFAIGHAIRERGIRGLPGLREAGARDKDAPE